MVAEGGEGENPLPFSPKTRRGVGYPGFVSLQVPTSEAAVSADTHAFARLPPGGLRKIVWVVFVAKPAGDLAHRPLGAWIPPLSPVDFLQAEFLTSCSEPMGPGLKTLGCYHNPPIR